MTGGLNTTASQRSKGSASSASRAGNVLLSYPQDEFGALILRRFIRILSALNIDLRVVADREIAPGIGLLHLNLPRQPGILRYSFFQAKATIALWHTRRSWDKAWFLVGGTAMA